MNATNSSSVNCTASSRVDDDGMNPFAGDPVIFHTPDYVEMTHLLSVRLGRTNNVSVLLDHNATPEQQKGYIEGILIGALGCFVFFTIWMICILVFKCCGPKRVGFFSGQRIRRPMPPSPPEEEMEGLSTSVGGTEIEGETDKEKAKRILDAFNEQQAQGGDDDNNGDLALKEENNNEATATSPTCSPAMIEYCENVKEWQHKVKKAERRQRRIRVVVIICCLGVIASSILMVVNGVDALMSSVGEARNGLGQVAGLATQGQDLVTQFVVGQEEATNATETMLFNLNVICPPVQEQLCADILTATDCNFTGIPYQQEVQEIVEYFDGVQDMLYSSLDGFYADLQEVIDSVAYIDSKIASFEWAFWVAAAFAILLAVLSFFIMIGIIMAWREKLAKSCFRWIRNLIVVPIFFLLVFLSLLFSCVFVVGSLTTSDVCYNSPDNVVLQVLNQFQDMFATVLFSFIVFYVSGCPPAVMPLDINGEVNTFLQYVNTVKTFLEQIQADQAMIAACGQADGSLITNVRTLISIICFLSNSMLDVRDYFNCNNWNPLYATFAYDATCYDATKGFVWISSTQLAIVFFSMIILLLRVACYELEDEEDFLKQRRFCARIFPCCFPAPKEMDEVNIDENIKDKNLTKPLDTKPSDNEAGPEPPAKEESVEPTNEAKVY